MKKFLLLIATLLVAGSGIASAVQATGRNKIQKPVPGVEVYPAAQQQNTLKKVRANADGTDQTLDFSYAEEAYSALTFGGISMNTIIYLCFEMPTEIQELYKGAKITGLNITAGTSNSDKNLLSRVTAFVNDDLTKVPTFKKAGNISTEGFGESFIAFDEPWEITAEKDLYIGYLAKLPVASNNLYFIPYDGVPTNYNSCLFNTTSRSSVAPVMDEWDNLGPSYGSLCVSARLESESLPQGGIWLDGMYTESYYPAGKITYQLDVRNFGASPINSVEVLTSGSNDVNYRRQLTLAEPLAPMSTQTLTITNVPNTKEGLFSLNAEITKVNNAKPATNSEYIKGTGYFSTYSDGMSRNLVMEEGTGAWCQWCPAGIVMMEYLKEKYDDRWFRIGVHYSDVMAVPSYQAFLYDYVAGFPDAWINRYYNAPPTASGINTYLDQVYAYLTSYPAYTDMILTAECDDDNKTVSISSDTQFSIDITDEFPHYLSFAVVEDGLGPYDQVNVYYNSGMQMGGWENLESPVSTLYDDVARSLNSYPGISDALPTTITKGSSYHYDTTMNIANVKSGNFRVIGMITNSVTGEIVNAAQAYVTKSAVENVANDEISIRIENGEIAANGVNKLNIYTLDGREVSNSGLAAGIYIVVADGKAQKVLVK